MLAATGCLDDDRALADSAARSSDTPQGTDPPDDDGAAGTASGPTTATTATTALAGAPAADDPELHVALRLTYGLRPGLLDEVRRLGVDRFVAAQLDPASLPDPPELDAAIATLRRIALPPRELLSARAEEPGIRLLAANELVLATILRQLHRPAQLHEQLVEFWSNHFSIHLVEGQQFALKPTDDRDVIRRHALGRFADLLVASAQSPAMLVSLDNATSRAGAINENYGRELLELHTVGVDAGYREADVVAVANTLTGWTIERDTFGFRFAPRLHDAAPQAVMTWRTPAGKDGFAVGLDLLDHLAHHEATATMVARKLCVRFVSDRPDPGLVAHVARAYLDADTAIAPTLRALFADERFLGTATAKYRRPHELFVAALRATGATIDTAALARVGARRGFNAALARLGQVPFDWPAPNGYPDVGAAWLGPGGLLARWNVLSDLLASAIPGVRPDLPLLRTATATGGGTGAGPAIAALGTSLLGAAPEPAAVAAVLDALDLDAAAPVPAADAPLRTATALLLATPRFQYR